MDTQDQTFSVSQIENLANLFSGKTDEDDEHVYGSMFAKETFQVKSKEEVAKPGVKMNIVKNNRAETGGAILTEE